MDKARKRVDMVWEEMIEEWNWRGNERGGWQGEDDKVEGMMREEVGVVCEKRRWERSVDVCLER